MSVPHAEDSRVVVYLRQNCHLCEVALETIHAICDPQAITVTKIDIDTDPRLQELFTDQVPVTFVDGRQHDFWRVDPARLTAALGR